MAQRALRPGRLRVRRRRAGGGIARALRAETQEGTIAVDAVVERARALGVLGWVRDDDGLVRAHLEGDGDAVDAVAALLGEGASTTPAKVEGHEQFAVRGVPAGAFAVHQDERGFELRLEVAGGVRAWALRKEPSMVPADKRMAIAAEPGEGGDVWDAGPYEQGGRVPWPEAIDRGHAVFVLHGQRLRGGFALQRTRGARWLLVKRRDELAR